jgi:uncharacterized membrane protein (DUF4010 family)
VGTGDLIASFLAAAGCGAVVGFERQAGKHERSVIYGVRTFALYGLWGAASVMFGDEFGSAAFVVSFATFGAMVVAAYVADVRATGDRGTTTEIASLTVFLIGVLAWQGHVVTSLALSVGTAALLRVKAPLRALTDRISEQDVRAVLQFAVITALVLPVVPNEDFGPFGAFNPHEVWLMVVLVSAIGLVGYGALRLRGERGLVLTGVLGGLVSSTAVTLSYGRMSHTMIPVSASLSAGILGASAVMYPRVLIEAAVIAPEMARSLLVPMLLMLAMVISPALYWFWRGRQDQSDHPNLELTNPLTLTTALQFGAIYPRSYLRPKHSYTRCPHTRSNLLELSAE